MFLNNIHMFLNNIYMSYNIIEHIYLIHRLTTYMRSLCNIFLHLSATITPFVALSADSAFQCFNGHANLLFPQSISIVLS